MQVSKKERLKRRVFEHFLKTDSDGIDVTCCGRVFHGRKTAIGKARSPMVERRVLRTFKQRGSTDSPSGLDMRCGAVDVFAVVRG